MRSPASRSLSPCFSRSSLASLSSALAPPRTSPSSSRPENRPSSRKDDDRARAIATCCAWPCPTIYFDALAPRGLKTVRRAVSVGGTCVEPWGGVSQSPALLRATVTICVTARVDGGSRNAPRRGSSRLRAVCSACRLEGCSHTLRGASAEQQERCGALQRSSSLSGQAQPHL